MNFSRRWMVILVLIGLTSTVSFGQVMSQVPASALVVVHVKNPQEMSTKVAALETQLGLPPIPPYNDLLGAMLKKTNAAKGINPTGEMAVALVDDGKGMNGPTAPVLVLISTTDYKAFLSNYPDATTDGAVSTLKMPDGTTVYSANWGDFIAISQTNDLVTMAPGGLTITPSAAKELDAHDATLLVNMPAVRARLTPLLLASRAQMLMTFNQGIRQTPYGKFAPVFRVLVNEVLDVFQAALNQCDDVTVGLSLGDSGIRISDLADFRADSHYGQMLAGEKDTDQPLPVGLPEGKYLVFGGGVADPKLNAQLLGEWLDPLIPELTNLGADGQTYVDYIHSAEAIAAAQTGASFGMVVPEGELGTSSLLQFIQIRSGDAKALADATSKVMHGQVNQAQTGLATAGVPIQMSYTPAGKTLDGVTFDQFHVGFDMAKAQTPQMARIGQILTFAYGADGMNVYSGVVNDTTYLQVGGLTDDKISPAIAAAKSGDAPLAQRTGVQDTNGQLPKARLAAFYFPLDSVVNAVFGYMAKFGLDMGVTMPECDPIGMTVSTDGAAARFDLFIPSQIMTSAAQIGAKLMAPHTAPGASAGGGGAAPPPPGGGL